MITTRYQTLVFVLRTEQASCLWDRSVPDPGLDHAAGGLLPGERFSADQQCILK